MNEEKVIKGILTDAWTNEKKEVKLEYVIETNANGTIFRLIGGPTGYESFYIDQYAREKMPINGWMACIGTEKRWDRLFISGEEMRKALSEVKL